MARRRECCVLLTELTFSVEQFMRSAALHPLFELLEMLRVLEILDWDLVRSPGPLHPLAVDKLRARPTLGGAKDDHRPVRTLRILSLSTGPRGALNPGNSC